MREPAFIAFIWILNLGLAMALFLFWNANRAAEFMWRFH